MRTLCRPLRRREYGEEIISVHPQAGQSVADGARGESRLLAASDALEARNRPLIVADIEDDRRAIDGGEGERRMEIAFRGRAFADPGCGEAVIALIGRRHRPAARLVELGGEVS